MLKWLSKLFRRNSIAFHRGSPSAVLPSVEPYPTREDVADWDDASLFAATGCASALRYYKDGFETLNDIERNLCCFCLLESNFNNGGAGQWIDGLCPLSAAETRRALQYIGATDMANFVTDVLRPLDNTANLTSKDAWVEHYLLSMADNVHEHWEILTPEYVALESHFLELAYKYARANWEGVRAA